MAGGGVGEAMLIGAAVGAGTGGIMSAAQDKDPLEGALLGAAMGAAGGGIGSGIGGLASGATSGATAGGTTGGITGGTTGGVTGGTTGGVTGGVAGGEVGGTVGGTVGGEVGGVAGGAGGAGAGAGGSSLTGIGDMLVSGGVQGGTTGGVSGGAGGGAGTGASWGTQGLGQGFAPTLTNAQAYGAGAGGGIMGLVGNAQNQGEQWAPEEDYTGSLSYFKYNPQTFQPSVAPGYADGGIASLGPQGAMYPQSQIPDRTQFAVPSQMPTSREVVGADYDARINPYTGDIPRFAGGGIGMIRSLQPGGFSGEMAGDIYGAKIEALPFLEKIKPGGFMGATEPGRLDYEDRKRAEEEAKAAEARNAGSTYSQVLSSMMAEEEKKRRFEQQGYARGGLSHLGYYSDGGRMLKGPGDGMSDDIPGVIAGKQPARLADGEFVVPADVVSHLGNGSTDAGAKKLYSMMDNVRKARTGSKKQGKQIKAEKHMPGMKSGGIAYYEEGGPTSEPMPEWFSNYLAEQQFAPRAGMGAVSSSFQPTGFTGTEQQYSPYTMANRPSSSQPQYYQDIYRPEYPDYSTPGYTLAGNLGQWSNVMGEQNRAAQPASMAQQVTQSYLQNLGRAPDTAGFNSWMQSGMTGPQINDLINRSGEAYQVNPTSDNATGYLTSRYQDILGRAPDQAGMDYWSNQLQSGSMNVNQIDQAMRQTPEAQIAQAYQQYLGRTADQPGQQYWSGRVESGDMSVDQAINAIKGSEEATAREAQKAQKKRSGGIASLV
jgi:hypothetical protein